MMMEGEKDKLVPVVLPWSELQELVQGFGPSRNGVRGAENVNDGILMQSEHFAGSIWL